MTLSPLGWSLLEKAARDNGFDVEGPRLESWRTYASSQTELRIWVGAVGPSQLLAAFSRRDVFEALEGLGEPWSRELPVGAAAAREVGAPDALHSLLRRAFQLARALPDEPLQRFLEQTRGLPQGTEAERLVVQRVGQDIFRDRLLDYWEGRCVLTGLAERELLRASHIKPWAAEGITDRERLDVFNGLLLAPHLDALFDRGFLTLDDEGGVLLATCLSDEARHQLGVSGARQLLRPSLDARHRKYLRHHREAVFRG